MVMKEGYSLARIGKREVGLQLTVFLVDNNNSFLFQKQTVAPPVVSRTEWRTTVNLRCGRKICASPDPRKSISCTTSAVSLLSTPARKPINVLFAINATLAMLRY